MLHFTAWNQDNLRDTTAIKKLEGLFSDQVVVVASYQMALQMCFELLGTRSHVTPVLMPITASPATLSAALRSGTHPALLDISAETLQMSTEAVNAVSEDLVEGTLAVLTQPAGSVVDARLVDALKDVPYLLDTGLPPVALQETDAVFSVYDLTPVVGAGAVIHTKYTKQLGDLRELRSGVLGYEGHLPAVLCEQACQRIPELRERQRVTERIIAQYAELFAPVLSPLFDHSAQAPYLFLAVSDAEHVISQLRKYEIEAKKAVFSLSNSDLVRMRWEEVPEYPNTEALENRVVALPAHPEVLPHVVNIVACVKDACDV